MADVLSDFYVLVETADGTLHPYRSEMFRVRARCPSTLSLATCVERYNARMQREGIRERAYLKLRKPRTQ